MSFSPEFFLQKNVNFISALPEWIGFALNFNIKVPYDFEVFQDNYQHE